MWPIPVPNIITFISYLSLNNFAPSTVSTYISGLSYHHKLRGLLDPTKLFLVQKTLEGLRRKVGKVQDVRSPITFEILNKIILALPHVCSSSYESQLFAASFTLAFFAFLRVSEFTIPNTNNVSDSALFRSDISMDTSSLNVRIRKSKTDQLGLSTTISIQKSSNKSICPITNMSRYLSQRPTTKSPFLFVHFNGQPLTTYQFKAVLKKALKFCDIKGHFRSHSFRIGAASEAYKLGFSDDIIQKWGRWKSQSYRTYIRLPNLFN